MMKRLLFALLVSSGFACTDLGDPIQQRGRISSDVALFTHVTRTEPFTTYALFPRADSVTAGSLNGSTAHRPLVRVSMNATAAAALRDGRYNAPFPDGSIIFKEIRETTGQTALYAVMYKDAANPLAGNGWLWAEYMPDGGVFFSIQTRGASCVGCHSREQGPHHDFVRTFERQR